MNKKSLPIVGSIVIIAILIGVVVLQGVNHTRQTITGKQSVNQRAPLPKEVTVTLNKNGFSPATVTINVGSAVLWKNKSGSKQTVNSDNYPTNQLYRELNFGMFANGSSVTYTFTKIGVYGYHNQLNPKQTGKIIVKN
jgi:plastocyanin